MSHGGRAHLYGSREATISLGLAATDKRGAIEELVDLLDRGGRVVDREGPVQTVLSREEQVSTGPGNASAIPYAKTDAMRRAGVAFSRRVEAIDWETLDASRANLLFLIAVLPAGAGHEHLEVPAMRSRRLIDDHWRSRLQEAGSSEEVLSLLGEVHA